MEKFDSSHEANCITFITGSQHKYQDLIDVFGSDFPYQFCHRKVDLPEYQDVSAAEIVKKKCILASKTVKGPIVVEDTSLCFNALNGLPGPYVKWFLEKLNPEGLFKLLHGWEDKSAHVDCFVAFSAGENTDVVLFEGRMEGIMVPPRGSGGFGFDPCFSPDEGQESLSDRLTLAEYPIHRRHEVSHRCKAFHSLKDYLLNAPPCDIGLTKI